MSLEEIFGETAAISTRAMRDVRQQEFAYAGVELKPVTRYDSIEGCVSGNYVGFVWNDLAVHVNVGHAFSIPDYLVDIPEVKSAVISRTKDAVLKDLKSIEDLLPALHEVMNSKNGRGSIIYQCTKQNVYGNSCERYEVFDPEKPVDLGPVHNKFYTRKIQRTTCEMVESLKDVSEEMLVNQFADGVELSKYVESKSGNCFTNYKPRHAVRGPTLRDAIERVLNIESISAGVERIADEVYYG